MTATLASGSWPLPLAAPRALPWLFGREVTLTNLPGAPRALQWLLKRNCSIAPRELGLVFALLCSVSLSIGAFFLAHGAPWVLAFACIELLCVGLAFLVFARHAGDREVLTLVGRRLEVEQCIASRVERAQFDAEWLRVEPAGGQGSLVQLSARGASVRVGRFLRPELRATFARELRVALRRAAEAPAESDPNRTLQ